MDSEHLPWWMSRPQRHEKNSSLCLIVLPWETTTMSPPFPFPTEFLCSWMPGCPWNMNLYFVCFAWQGGITEPDSYPSFSGWVPCLRRFYCNFPSMDLIVYWHCSVRFQFQLGNAYLGRQLHPDLRKPQSKELILFTKISTFQAPMFTCGAPQKQGLWGARMKLTRHGGFHWSVVENVCTYLTETSSNKLKSLPSEEKNKSVILWDRGGDGHCILLGHTHSDILMGIMSVKCWQVPNHGPAQMP